ncbi:MAG TPA: dTDP-4-dehydrorhamnose 3,5-epimerase [Alphaproteobacteria bacterium]|jgi:dTDP-4-dehydrorhamnose 3,5-epimerase|nr:dTDP-4-dehydrorhamnose 3,5-epimerase [Alphaproteobacteria bacterium]
MRFRETTLPGVWLIEPEPMADERGHFARAWCARELQAQGLEGVFVQSSVSYNRRRGTLRGLHYQAAPHGEAKLVRCIQGAVFDVAVDLRAGAPTEGRWYGVELSAANGRTLYIPAGCAHGFQSLSDDAEVLYHMTAEYRPEAARGVRWDDATLGISWPIADPILSDRDRALPAFVPSATATSLPAARPRRLGARR